jgi:dipeptidyl-peptidase-4
VDGIDYVDHKHRHLYFSGRKSTVLQKHLYRTQFSRYDELVQPADIEAITVSSQGWHSVVFSRKSLLFLDRCCSFKQPPQVSLCRIVATTDGPSLSSPPVERLVRNPNSSP